MRRTVLATIATVAAWPLHAGVLAGQTLGAPRAPGGAELPEWLTSWSPVGLTGDLPRELPGHTLAIPLLLTAPAPRTGAFWTAGNPGAVPWDVRDSYTQFRFGARQDDGAYRRPLDPGQDTRRAGSAFGWKNLGPSGAAIGRVVIDHMAQDAGAHADVVLPHSSNPFVLLDTLGDRVSGLVARLDGAGGWRLGRLGIGLGLGYDGREVRTVASPAPIQYRVSAAGVTAGVNYEVLRGLLQLGVFTRWEQLTQNALVSSFGVDTRVYVLRGYFAPTPIDLGGASVATYRRKLVREARAFGASLAGAVGDVVWTAYAQRNTLSEGQSVEFAAAPPTDDWDARGWSAGVAAQARLTEGLVLATFWGRYRGLDGRATRMDLDVSHFAVDQSDWQVAAEVRVFPVLGWMGAVRVATGRESWLARDSLAGLASDLKAWMPAASIEVARALPAGFAVAVGAGYVQHAPWGAIPDPTTQGDGYRDWIGPELSLYGTKAATVTESATLRWRARTGLEVWMRGTLASLSGRSGVARLPLAPEGSRERRAVTFGLTMREP